jgi:hypothetical protein
VDSATQITLDQPASASGSAVVLNVMNEPVSVAQTKRHARIEYSADDALVARKIVAARKDVETRLNQQLMTMTIGYFADNWPWLGGYYNRVMRQQAIMGPMPYWLPASNSGILNLYAAPLQTVNIVQYKDFNGVYQTIDPSLYIFDQVTIGSAIVGTSRIQPAYAHTWPIPQPTIDSVHIQFTVGYGSDWSAIPENIKEAILVLAADLYQNREETGGSPIVSSFVDSLLTASDHGAYS